jgi:thioredoxin reductase
MNKDEQTPYDVIIVGAGPAGLSAALVLGRSRRRVLVCSAGEHRNAASRALHGFLSRDGIDPRELLRIGRQQLERYDTVKVQDVEVMNIKSDNDRFAVSFPDGTQLFARKVLLATGVIDELPDIHGFDAFYGRSIFHCPYCDGWEVRDLPLAIYGRGANGPGLAQELTSWSSDLTLVTDGPPEINAEDREQLARNRIQIRQQKIARLEGNDGILECIVFDDGSSLKCRAMFFNLGHRQHTDLAARLGVNIDPHGNEVMSNRHESTNVPGVYVAGDAAFHTHFVIIAASEGAIAAFAINSALLREGNR